MLHNVYYGKHKSGVVQGGLGRSGMADADHSAFAASALKLNS